MPLGVIEDYLNILLTYNASDLYLSAGYKPLVRQNNELVPIGENDLKESDIEQICQEVLNDIKRKEFNKNLELNMSVTLSNKVRYRLNFLKQQQRTSIVARKINTEIPPANKLGLLPIYQKLSLENKGLILIAGIPGSGKTTSATSMIDYRSKKKPGHILTIEDPIEFIYPKGKSLITQREVGEDTLSFHNALKNALRQNADVIMIGEIRDADAMENAIRFAETGHLCIATIHANSTYQALDRIINLFPDQDRRHICFALATNLLGILAQKLILNTKEEYSLVSEVLLNKDLIKSLIMQSKLEEVKEALEKSMDHEMQTFDDHLLSLYEKHIIKKEVVLAEADDVTKMHLKLNIEDEKDKLPTKNLNIDDFNDDEYELDNDSNNDEQF